MPLEKGKSNAAFDSNVAELIKAGHPRDQALAAAYRMKGEGKEARTCESKGNYGFRSTRSARSFKKR